MSKVSFWISLATTGACLAGPAAAHAGVATAANTGRGYDRGCAATYNTIATGAAFVINDGSNANCISGGGPGTTVFNNQTVTVAGTTNTAGNFTASHDSSSVAGIGSSDIAYATSTADLATGRVNLSTSANGFSEASAQAQLTDVLHFTIAGANANTVTDVPVSFSFSGQLGPGSDPATASSELNYGFHFGNASATEFGDYAAGYYGEYGTYPKFAYAGAPNVAGFQSSAFASYNPLDTSFSGVYALVGSAVDIPLSFFLAVNSSNDTIDFLKGDVNIGNVSGVSYISDSGVFLSANDRPGAVPESSTWAMMIAGMGVIGAVVRRQSLTPRRCQSKLIY